MTIGVYSHNDVVAYVEFKNDGKVIDTMQVGNWALEDTLRALRKYTDDITVFDQHEGGEFLWKLNATH